MTDSRPRTVALVVCDMAGTTIDDHGLVYGALRDCVVELGLPVSDADLQAWMGTDKREAIAALIGLGGGSPEPALVAEAFGRFLALLDRAYTLCPPVALARVEVTLAELRAAGVRVALTSGFSRDVAVPLLQQIGWAVGQNLDALVCADEVAAGRPAPYLIHRAMERTGTLDVRSVIAVGDTAVDLQAAHHAGVLGVGVRTGKLTAKQLASQPHCLILDSVADLPGSGLLDAGRPVLA